MKATSLMTGTVLPDAILTEAEFCSHLKIGQRTAERWRTTGQGPCFLRLGPRRIGYRRRDVDQWLSERTFGSVADELARTCNT
jgi:predicted DNA-binding transcriptional regulator AlpA